MSVQRAETDLAEAKAEIARLEQGLLPLRDRVEKLENYIEMARAYEIVATVQKAALIRRSPKSGGVGAVLVQAAIRVIREKGTRQTTNALIEALETQGHRIGGTNKVTNLSSSLSRSEILTANRRLGWGLKEWGDSPVPTSQTTVESADIPY